jgi:hypothetical protein
VAIRRLQEVLIDAGAGVSNTESEMDSIVVVLSTTWCAAGSPKFPVW